MLRTWFLDGLFECLSVAQLTSAAALMESINRRICLTVEIYWKITSHTPGNSPKRLLTLAYRRKWLDQLHPTWSWDVWDPPTFFLDRLWLFEVDSINFNPFHLFGGGSRPEVVFRSATVWDWPSWALCVSKMASANRKWFFHICVSYAWFSKWTWWAIIDLIGEITKIIHKSHIYLQISKSTFSATG